ncbi:hypothetical protein JCM6882_004259 [Rhodosporidiobolus microsporus]
MRRTRPFHPPANRESFRDLLLFEERLKQNNLRLQKQRRKYEAFLIGLVAVIAYLAYLVFVIPSIYSLVHYGNVAMLLVAATTLVLFFATGMYSEKIAYAHKFVPQANRALRPFNVYLNTRHRSRFSIFNLFRSTPPSPASTTLSRTPSGRSIASDLSSPPLSRRTSASSTHSNASSSGGSGVSFRSSGAFRSPPVSPPSSPPLHASSSLSPTFPSPPPSPPAPASPSLAPSNDPVTRAPVPPPQRTSTLPPGGGVPIPPIPPAQNPRGEIIFSSRVAPQFREGYERYRGEWERRRAEAKRQQLEREGGWVGWAIRPWNWGRGRSASPAGYGAGGAAAGKGTVGEKGDKREPRSRETSVAPSEGPGGDLDGEMTGSTSDGGLASFPPSRSPSPPLEPLIPEGSLTSSALLSSTSTPASSAPPSRSPSPLPLRPSSSSSRASPPAGGARRSSLSPVRGQGSPGRIRAESFSELITLENDGEQERPEEAPGMRRSGSMRGLGLGG